MAAVGEILGAAGVRGEGWRLQREATGGGGAPERRVGASAMEEVAGKALHGDGGRRCRWAAARTEQGGGGRG